MDGANSKSVESRNDERLIGGSNICVLGHRPDPIARAFRGRRTYGEMATTYYVPKTAGRNASGGAEFRSRSDSKTEIDTSGSTLRSAVLGQELSLYDMLCSLKYYEI